MSTSSKLAVNWGSKPTVDSTLKMLTSSQLKTINISSSSQLKIKLITSVNWNWNFQLTVDLNLKVENFLSFTFQSTDNWTSNFQSTGKLQHLTGWIQKTGNSSRLKTDDFNSSNWKLKSLSCSQLQLKYETFNYRVNSQLKI